MVTILTMNATTHYIVANNYSYSPSNITINQGDTVIWNNNGGFHDVNGDINTLTGTSFNNPVSFYLNPVNGGNTIGQFVFNVPGTYNYDCSIGSHAAFGMFASITVIAPPNSVYDIISSSSSHTTLKTAIDMCTLDGTLSGPGPFTVFAPTDNAFNNLPSGTLTALLNDLPALTDILLHHVVADSVMSGMLSNNQVVTTLLGTDITVTINANGVYIDNALVTLVDLVGDNGVVHVIDAVLIPNTSSNSVYDIISSSPSHTILNTAVTACSLDGTLSGPGPFTVFAPTDGAFNNLPAGTVTSLLNDIPALTDILLHHVVGDSVMSGMLSNNQVVTTLLGTDVIVTINSNGVYIDNALVTLVDLVGDNGVVHVIDAVLVPNFDCNGVFNGPALVDTCGDCQLAYVYDYVTHNVTFVNDTINVTLGANEILVLPDNPMNPYWNSGCVPNTVYDIISNSVDHTTLKTAIDATGLDGFLSSSGPFTIFAPTDAAFANLPAGTVTALLNDLPQLTNILKHHVVADSVMSTMLSNNQVVTTLLGTDVTVTITSNGVYIDNALVTVVDLVGDNGVVHVIDAVLLPPTPPNTVYNIISNSAEHTTLKTAINACSLDGTLSGPGPFTVFAPTDNAFNSLPAGTVTSLLNDIPQLTDILKHHVVGDSVMSGMLSNNQVVTTLLGTDVVVTINSNGVYIDNAMVTVVDLVGDNGVVHVIDAVLLPNTTSQIDEINSPNKKYLHTLNILGMKVDDNLKNQLLFRVYSDGSIEKTINK